MEIPARQSLPAMKQAPSHQGGQKGDPAFRLLVTATGVGVLVVLGAIIAVMVTGGWKAFATFGPGFLVSAVWNPVTQHFGAAAPVFGTVISSALALLVAVPLAFGTAFWLTALAPPAAASVIGMAVQLLAAVPSIIFGMWGFFVVVPVVAHYVQPAARQLFGHVPGLSALVAGAPFGTGLFTAALILAVMITPSITAVMRDVFLSMPAVLRESGYGLGATRWEVMRHVVLPWSRQGVVGGIVLGMGRAMGETMAVTFVIGDSNHIGWSLFAPANTIASLIALEFPESPAGSLKLASLMALGAILMAISFVTLWFSRWLLARGEQAAGR
ncbi:MAG: phosphate ABC transporter permease subunit PstC [Acetobacter fabarum]|jgi:phosphate transport system permease protein|uniref:Phosphate transport system permease protein n=1 Tax=Acetobacter fabarum TaxID=483199 RepID=A0A269XY99_9PROT|nr:MULTISPECIES: phosphate ABC transporter permease subunit PstC [Acetobacter]MCH4025168.1 phosphate ABC transporter permease subunit PstC [Acetobacter fabarum]MCH4055183.1 phosphate ABC transporter permease subunit PstC [Acetobacter fabarum]MCH4128014.1 phosphate ABC transporter permease subunit PstC [Acetobacter fabarum]MCH4141225.1 phosphate ABC transporter permease subunit PstC [Acetobacter fabarum]MCI1243563.1 phosphate ABC transporter permease subunit PstC [Acetobacter fabarum]